jgi:hypothetical protein
MLPDDDSHQLKIRKLQERLSNISSEFRSGLANDIQNRRQSNIGNIYSTSPSNHIQKQAYNKIEKEVPVEEVLQQLLKQTIERKQLATRVIETQQKQMPPNKESSEDLKIQELDQFPLKQDAQNRKPWKFIPREKLDYLERKKLDKFFKK